MSAPPQAARLKSCKGLFGKIADFDVVTETRDTARSVRARGGATVCCADMDRAGMCPHGAAIVGPSVRPRIGSLGQLRIPAACLDDSLATGGWDVCGRHPLAA